MAADYSILKVGMRYTVLREFRDHDDIVHPVGETWTYLDHGFVPYHDGLTWFVSADGHQQQTIRLWCAMEGQGAITRDLGAYLRAVEPLPGVAHPALVQPPPVTPSPDTATRSPHRSPLLLGIVDIVLRVLAGITAVVALPLALLGAAFVSDSGTDAAKSMAMTFLFTGLALSSLLLLASAFPRFVERFVPGPAVFKKVFVRTLVYAPALGFVALRIWIAASRG